MVSKKKVALVIITSLIALIGGGTAYTINMFNTTIDNSQTINEGDTTNEGLTVEELLEVGELLIEKTKDNP